MTTPAKLYGKDLSEYDEIDVEELLSKLTTEEINILAKEVDPDVSIARNRSQTASNRRSFRIHFYRHRNDVVTNVKKIPPAR